MGKSNKGGKTTKGGKTMNPTDAYRKELRKKELKRNKKERKKVREVGILKKDPETLRDQISKLEAMKADGALDKARKHKKRQLEDTLNLVLKKRKEYEEKMKEKGETPVMFSHLGPVRKHATAEDEERSKNPKPEDSVYYHPTLNPSGAPPPGKPPMFKSSVGPKIPLPEASSSNAGSSSVIESEDGTFFVPPFVTPPPLPPMGSDSGDFIFPESLPSLPAVPANEVTAPALPPPPPPPPGPPPKELLAFHTQFPRPSTVYQSMQPPHLGVAGAEEAPNPDDVIPMDSVQTLNHLPPPPPPPVGSPTSVDKNHLDGSSSEATNQLHADEKDAIKAVPPPPPPAPRQPLNQQPHMPGGAVGLTLLPDLVPRGVPRFPPPPPPNEMMPLLSAPGITGQSIPPEAMVPLYMRPPFGPPPGYMLRPPLPPGPPPLPPPPFHQDELMARPPPSIPLKPSYVKSAAPTVVKRPLAQHTPELTAMVPASVRVRRESAQGKPKPKSSSTLPAGQPSVAAPPTKQETPASSLTQKPPSIDDSYMAFLKDMKALGALDS